MLLAYIAVICGFHPKEVRPLCPSAVHILLISYDVTCRKTVNGSQPGRSGLIEESDPTEPVLATSGTDSRRTYVWHVTS